ncbi:MAG: hypothetical protein D6743_03530 [Calditrichaeota bacterium]|nr:MAG: hypothetical protein D6743_03530 [Calditrichota bacterium]
MSLQSNFKIKIISLFLAIFIWFFVVTENEYEYEIDIPVSVTNIPEGMVLLNELPKTARVKVKGSGKDLISLGVNRRARLVLDLTDAKKIKTFVLRPENIFLSRSPRTLQTEEIIAPDSITVILDKFQRRKVPVVPRVKPKVAAGYTVVGSPRLVPDSVVVSGPQSIVSQIDQVYTEALQLTDLRFDVTRDVPLAALPSNRATLDVHQVTLSLNVQKLSEITFTGIPVKVKNVPRGLSVHVVPSTLSLVLEGGSELLREKVKREDIKAYIDYRRVRGALGKEHPAVIETPPGTSHRDARPKTFRLVVERASSR